MESGGTLEAQVVNWSDEIAQQTHDLEDGISLAGEEGAEALAVSRLARAVRGGGDEPAVRRASLIRGVITTLISDLVAASRARIERWLDASRISTPDEFFARREHLPGDLVGFSDEGRRLYTELKEFVYRHIIHSFPVSRHDGRARRVVAGLYRAYAENPRLLPDSVLEVLRQELQIRFLREVPLSEIKVETAANYIPRPEFYRAIADHIAGMTDSYCIADYRELVTE
jgi:dGTPase